MRPDSGFDWSRLSMSGRSGHSSSEGRPSGTQSSRTRIGSEQLDGQLDGQSHEEAPTRSDKHRSWWRQKRKHNDVDLPLKELSNKKPRPSPKSDADLARKKFNKLKPHHKEWFRQQHCHDCEPQPYTGKGKGKTVSRAEGLPRTSISHPKDGYRTSRETIKKDLRNMQQSSKTGTGRQVPSSSSDSKDGYRSAKAPKKKDTRNTQHPHKIRPAPRVIDTSGHSDLDDGNPYAYRHSEPSPFMRSTIKPNGLATTQGLPTPRFGGTPSEEIAQMQERHNRHIEERRQRLAAEVRSRTQMSSDTGYQAGSERTGRPSGVSAETEATVRDDSEDVRGVEAPERNASHAHDPNDRGSKDGKRKRAEGDARED